MNDEHFDMAGRTAANLRRAFDQSFAEPAHGAIDDVENFLGLRVGPDEFAVRLGEVRGLLPEQKIVVVPSPVPELLGIIGLRGSVIPIYSLGALLGYVPTPSLRPWIILAETDGQIGFAFEHFQGHLRVGRSQISPNKGDDKTDDAPSRPKETVRIGSALRGIISIRGVVLALADRLGIGSTVKET